MGLKCFSEDDLVEALAVFAGQDVSVLSYTFKMGVGVLGEITNDVSGVCVEFEDGRERTFGLGEIAGLLGVPHIFVRERKEFIGEEFIGMWETGKYIFVYAYEDPSEGEW
ncbi:MAG: hypothetical protein II839_05890 [Kiritimatiellae bacterium]|nr:hypothetical protein [Kiritimatiellia bacterium]